jgi:hypothetical protein
VQNDDNYAKRFWDLIFLGVAIRQAHGPSGVALGGAGFLCLVFWITPKDFGG